MASQRTFLVIPFKNPLRFLFLLLVCSFTSNVLFVSGNEQNVTTITTPTSSEIPNLSSDKPKLKICASNAVNLDSRKNVTIQVPAYSISLLAYILEEFEVDEKTLETCSNGEKPVAVNESIATKTDFEELSLEGLKQMLILRNINLLLDNGYLSLGNGHTSEYYAPHEYCISEIKNKGELSTALFQTCPVSNSSRPVLPKCCPVGMYLNASLDCVENPDKQWDPRYMDAKTWKFIPIEEANPVIKSPLLMCDADFTEFWDADNCDHEFHPATDNTVAFLGAYRTWEFLDAKTEWCIETHQDELAQERMVLFYCVKNETSTDSNKAKVSLVYMVSMYIGAGFHFLTTLVYLITWPKQNIHGKTLCSCTASLLLMNLFLGTAHLLGILENQRNSTWCIVNSIGGQYFMIAAFTWLLVVNFDLWRTFRSMRTEGGKSKKRFLIYSTIGWAFPSTISIISIAMNFTFRCRNSHVVVPEFGEYYCFVAPWAQGLYVYYILGVLMATSIAFAALTLVGLYNFKKDAVNLRSNRGAQDQQNILLFLKLSVVMGLTWVFEVISWAATRETENHIFWIVLDLYNALSAILIFLIFVCKKTTLNLLEQSVPKLKGLTGALTKLTTTFAGESTSDNTASTVAAGSQHRKPPEANPSVSVVQFRKEKSSVSEN